MALVRRLRPNQSGASRFDIAHALAGQAERVAAHARDPLASYSRVVPGVDDLAVLEKARRLIKKRVIQGCDCGCPGYFTLAGEVPVLMPGSISATGA
jgi:hypothetical protein